MTEQTMLIDQLHQLVRRYVLGQIKAVQFREAFVSGFLSVDHADPVLQKLVHSVESACADFSEGFQDEQSLRASLAHLVQPQQLPASTTASFSQEYVQLSFGGPAGVISDDASTEAGRVPTIGAVNSPVVRVRIA